MMFKQSRLRIPLLIAMLTLVLYLVGEQSATPAVTAQSGSTYYLSPNGNDSADGASEGSAWATFNRAWQDLYPGDTLVLLDGIYYQSLAPSEREGEPGKPITIRAKNDGQVIIDGEYERIPINLSEWIQGYQHPDYFTIEGVVARNSSGHTIYLQGATNNLFRRVTAMNAHPDRNASVINMGNGSDDNLFEDCVAYGSGRKMILIFKSENNTIRRCYADWRKWDGKEFHDVWPWGDGIEFYNSSNNIIENSITNGHFPTWSISVMANSETVSANNNQVLGSIALGAGVDENGQVIDWGQTRPQPSQADTDHVRNFDGWLHQRVGFSFWGQGQIDNNVMKDIFAWGNAGMGLGVAVGGERFGNTFANNQVIRATILNNGLDAPRGEGGIGTEVSHIEEVSIQNSYIEGDAAHQGEGARLVNRYVDGEQTDQSLWPWPMEERIQQELSFSVTCEVGRLINGYTSRKITNVNVEDYCLSTSSPAPTYTPGTPGTSTMPPTSTPQPTARPTAVPTATPLVGATPAAGVLTGYVFVDENGDNQRGNQEEAVERAVIMLRDVETNGATFSQTAITNQQGAYRFTFVPPGKYVLIFSVPFGYTVENSARIEITTDGNNLEIPNFAVGKIILDESFFLPLMMR